ncbi:MAG: glycosyltransferase [Symploca sp. SIO2E9]|nr:glycosyltransferase [Symploca sp. SIO2E9]
MKISIITPVYNAVNTLEKTILSVVNQEITSELEYIIVDGGSTDGSLEIINRYLDKIGLFISEKDLGVYDAMNKGVTRATGDIIGIINSDDWYNDGAIKIVESFFREHQEASIIYSPINNYFDGNYLNTFIPGNLDNLVFKFTINHPSCFVKKSVYERVGLFDLCYSIAADYDFILRSYTSGVKFNYIETPLVSYSLNGMSGKPINKFKQIRESWRIGSKIDQQLSGNLRARRRRFYLVWFCKELLFFPVKQFIKPQTTRKIKNCLRQKIGGKLPSDNYGSW